MIEKLTKCVKEYLEKQKKILKQRDNNSNKVTLTQFKLQKAIDSINGFATEAPIQLNKLLQQYKSNKTDIKTLRVHDISKLPLMFLKNLDSEYSKYQKLINKELNNIQSICELETNIKVNDLRKYVNTFNGNIIIQSIFINLIQKVKILTVTTITIVITTMIIITTTIVTIIAIIIMNCLIILEYSNNIFVFFT